MKDKGLTLDVLRLASEKMKQDKDAPLYCHIQTSAEKIRAMLKAGKVKREGGHYVVIV